MVYNTSMCGDAVILFVAVRKYTASSLGGNVTNHAIIDKFAYLPQTWAD